MKNVMLPETLPISSLNTLEYCSRRFYYQFVQADMVVNDFVLAGTLLHRKVHQAGSRTVEGMPQTTRLYLYSEMLRLSGFTDVIEEAEGVLIPVEYKHGKQGQWLNDAIQLCAQALCLEERQAEKSLLQFGYIFYASTRRRVRVMFDEELRNITHAAIKRAFVVAALQQPPPPLDETLAQRCIHCSLLPLCLPSEVRHLQRVRQKGV